MHSRRRQTIPLAALVVGALAAGLCACRPALNGWPMVNAPARPGPVVCFGDSLVAGTGADTAETTYPAWLGQRLQREVNAFGVPGETAAEGLACLRQSPGIRGSVVIVTLGGNDLLRQVPWETTATALGSLFEELQRRGALIAFTGVEGPLRGRAKRYAALCRQHGVVLIPDVLAGILSQESLKADYVHPNGEGYRVMAERVAATLAPFLQAGTTPRATGPGVGSAPPM